MTPQAPNGNRVGQVLLGKLEVIRWLGGGGMGDVYEVEHLLTRHRRALKIVRPEYAQERRFIERLLREASIAGRLGTPYVVETLDAGRLDDGSAYVLMELLAGRSLQNLLETEGRLSQKRVASLACQVAEGVAIAHAAGIVHRDLKPENIFVIDDGDGRERIKILDFGISKFLEGAAATNSKLTREGTVLGTPFYMAPEQASGREVDGRSDVWSLGVIMYEALTGRLPFEGTTVGELFIQIGAGHYPPLEHRRSDLDPAFVRVVAGTLRANPAHRYPSAEALRRELLPFAASVPASRAKTISDGVRANIGNTPLPPPPSIPHGTIIETQAPPPRIVEVVTPAPVAEEPTPIVGAVPAHPDVASRNKLVLASAITISIAIVSFTWLFTRQAEPDVRTVAEEEEATLRSDSVATEEIVSDAGITTTSVHSAQRHVDDAEEPSQHETPAVPRTPRARDRTTRDRDRVRGTKAQALGLESNPYGP